MTVGEEDAIQVRSAVQPPSAAAARLFAGPGEMRALCRALDWATTPLGPVERWPLSLRTLVDALLASRNPMLLFWGPDLVQIYNDAFRPSLGSADGPAARHPRALGMPAAEFWTDVWDVVGPQIEGVMTRGEAVWHEDLYLPIERDGVMSDAWWTYSYSPARDDEGRIAGTLVVCLETTSRVLAERRMQTLNRELEVERSRLAHVFQQAPAFLAVLRGSPQVPYVFEYVNDAYYGVVGHRELVGRRVFEALPDVVGQGFDTLLDRVVATGEPFVGSEVPVMLRRTPGAPAEERFLDFVYYPLVEADGSRSGVIAHGVDVTEHVRARRAAERAQRASEEANRAKSDFLAAMSHELRTPLNAIAGYTELLAMGIHGDVTAAQREALGRIRRSEQHLLALINDVLNFAKLEAGRVQYEVEDVRLAEVAADVLAMIEPQLQARGIEAELRITPGIVARADREKVGQILLNLLSNAAKFTEHGGRVVIDGGASGAADARVRLTVADTGIGIPRNMHESIFDPFVQVHRRLTSATEGTGLGLAISRDLARAMGGDLTVDSEPGRGSTFTLELPAAAELAG